MRLFGILLFSAVLASLFAQPLHAGPLAKDDVIIGIEVRSGNVYDYVLLGMKQDATDGFDNAYDTVTPGLNVNDSFISVVVPHPEWKAVKTDFRSDFRPVREKSTWEIAVTGNVPPGTPLTMSIDDELSLYPARCSVDVEDMATGEVTSLSGAPYTFLLNGKGIAKQFRITIKSKKPREPRRHNKRRWIDRID